MSASPLSEALSALSGFLVAEASIGDTLQRVAEITARAVPGTEFVGMSMLDEHGRPSTTVYTDEDSPEIDRCQYESGRGPCLEAWRTGRPVRIDDIEANDDFPEFRRAALDHGVLSILSEPLAAGGVGIGAMNLYATRRKAFSDADEELGAELATAASVVLANATAYWGAYEMSQHLESAMQSRAVIEQAKGILMAQSPQLGSEEAFDLLVKASQRENVKLRDIAKRIVDRRPAPEPDA
jgi:GAF domain-containing protein